MILQGKKLLLLGANAETIPIVRRAKEFGVKVYVTDHIKNSPAKEVADGYYDINGVDEDEIIRIINSDKFDGVLLGVADPLTFSYVNVCKKLGFPCMVDENALEFCSNKSEFKRKCSEAGIHTAKEFFLSDNLAYVSKRDITFPIILKPAISRGGNGINICRNWEELEKFFDASKAYSDNGMVIGEQYINAEDCVATYIIINNEISLISMSDRCMLKNGQGIGTVTYSSRYESIYLHEFREKHLTKFENLFRNLKISNGIINIQMFKTVDDFIPYDSDCILNGENTNNLLMATKNIDLLGGMILYSLTGRWTLLESGLNNRCDKCYGASVWILCKAGKIAKISGLEEVQGEEYFIDGIRRLKDGAVITDAMEATEKATAGRVWIQADTREKLSLYCDDVRKRIKVIGENSKILNVE